MNANIYLIVLTLADSIFLTGILLICFKVDWIAYEYCVGLEYVLMTASYISSWSTAALTIERYLAIAHPLSHMKVIVCFFGVFVAYLIFHEIIRCVIVYSENDF